MSDLEWVRRFTEADSSFLASVAHNDTGDRDCGAKAYIQKIA